MYREYKEHLGAFGIRKYAKFFKALSYRSIKIFRHRSVEVFGHAVAILEYQGTEKLKRQSSERPDCRNIAQTSTLREL